MPFFIKASNFTINDTTMNDVGGDTTNNNTTNDNRSNCNNRDKSTVQGSYNNYSQRVVAGGAKTINNNNGGGSFYQANGVQNVHASPSSRQGRARQTGVAPSLRPATGPANLAARAGGRPRHAIDRRPYNPTYSLSQSFTREALLGYVATPSHGRKDILGRDPRGYSDQPQPRSLIPTPPTPDFGDDWNDELTGPSAKEYEDVDDQGDVETFGKRPLDDERSHSHNPAVLGGRSRR